MTTTKKFDKFINKTASYISKNLNDRYNLLNAEQKAKVKISVQRYREPVKIAIEQAFFFNKISCPEINEYLRVNNLI